jgi:hypothetical protein
MQVAAAARGGLKALKTDPSDPMFCKNDFAWDMSRKLSYYAWQNRLITDNSHPSAPIWVTLYGEDPISNHISQSGWVQPREVRQWCLFKRGSVEVSSGWPKFEKSTIEYSYDYTIKAEMMDDQHGQCPNGKCCETQFRTRWNWPNIGEDYGWYKVAFKANAQRCWIETDSMSKRVLPYR